MLQLFYDQNDTGKHLRKYTGWSLAWWHNYKWATYRILLVFGPDLIGPLFHRIFPDRSFDARKMSVPSATAVLSYIRLSYSSVKDDLDAAIKLGNAIMPNQMIMLMNLRDLFEYFIPTVGTLVEVVVVCFSRSVFLTSAFPVFNMPNLLTLIFYLLIALLLHCLVLPAFIGTTFKGVIPLLCVVRYKTTMFP